MKTGTGAASHLASRFGRGMSDAKTLKGGGDTYNKETAKLEFDQIP